MTEARSWDGWRAEVYVLGGLVADPSPEELEAVLGSLDGSEFHRPEDRTLFEAIRAVRKRGEPLDLVTVSGELEAEGAEGLADHLAALTAEAAGSAGIEAHAREVRRAAERREKKRKEQEVRNRLFQLGQSSNSNLEGELQEILGEIRTNSERPRLQLRTLAELLEDPELLRPPRAVAPRFAWKGRVTLLAAREKRGKSTLAAACAASVSRGGKLLGVECEAGPVLWLALEEHPTDLARKLVAFRCDPARVYVLERLRTPLSDLRAYVEAVEPALVVVDTLPAFAGLLEARPEPGSSSDWTRVMTSLAHVARGSDLALLLLHHADKVRGQYRDSTAIGAGVDVIIEMAEDVDHPGVRKVETRARWKVGPWSYRLEGDPMNPGGEPRLVLVEGGPTIREQVIAYVSSNPGASTRDTQRAVSGRTKAVGEAVKELLQEGVIEDRGGPQGGRSLHPAEHPHGTALEAVGKRSGSGTRAERFPGGDPLCKRGPPEAPPLGSAASNEGNRCACGALIGPSVEACADCRYGGPE